MGTYSFTRVKNDNWIIRVASQFMDCLYTIKITLVFSLAVLFTGAVDLPGNTGPSPSGVSPLFLSMTGSPSEVLPPEEGVIRTKVIDVHAEIMQGLQSDPAKGPTQFSMELFDGDYYICEVESVVRPPGSSTIVRAHMVGELASVVTLVGRANTLVGSIQIQKKSYQIRRSEQGQHLLQEINPDLLPPD